MSAAINNASSNHLSANNAPPVIKTTIYNDEDDNEYGSVSSPMTLDAKGGATKLHSSNMLNSPEHVQEPEYYPLINAYLHLALEQMQPCNLMDADHVGCYKGRRLGFTGLACKHCIGQAGCGRYFPASEASLSQTTTSQTIVNPVRNCRRCPIEIREQLELMKRAKAGPDFKKVRFFLFA